MENSVLVKVDKREQDLVEETLRHLPGKRLVSVLLHVLLQVELQVLEDEVELLLGVDDFLKSAQGLSARLEHGVSCTYSTTFGCLRPFSRLISRMAVEGTPSSSFSRRIFFRATIWPVTKSRHL